MRCLSCDKLLSDLEATRKGKYTGEYVDLCDSCYEDVDFEAPLHVHDDFDDDDDYRNL